MAASARAVTLHAGLTRSVVLLLGGTFFAVLLTAAVVFHEERGITFDAGYYVYRIVQDGACFYANGRVGECWGEALPVLVRRLGAPLRAVMMAFSLSYVLVYVVPFLLTVRIARRPAQALAIPLLLALGVRHVFYWTQNELLEGLGLLCFGYAWLHGRDALTLAVLAGASAGVWVMVRWFHPATAVAVVFLLGFEALDKGRWREARFHVLVLAAVAIVGWWLVSVSRLSYEGGVFLSDWASLRDIVAPYAFCRFLAHVALAPSLALLAVAAHYLHHRALGKCTLVVGTFLTTAFVVFWRFQEAVGPHYLEHMCLPLAFICAIPLAWDVLPALGGRRGIVVAAGVLALGAGALWRTHPPYTRFLRTMEAVLDRVEDYPERKFIIDVPMFSSWAFPTQTLLYSALTRAEPVTILVTGDPTLRRDLVATDAWVQEGPSVLARIPHDRLDARYFPLRRTPYRVLDAADLRR